MIQINPNNKIKTLLLQRTISIKTNQIHHNKNKTKNPSQMKDSPKLLMIQDFYVPKSK